MAAESVLFGSRQDVTRPGAPGWLKHHSLRAFFVLTFAYSYLVGFPLLAPIFGISFIHLPPLVALGVQLLAAWAPTLTAIGLTYLGSGVTGVRRLLVRLTWWRVGVGWYAFVLLTPAAVILVALGLHTLLGGALPSSVQLTPWSVPVLQFLTAFPLYLFVGGPLGEEFGWRGYALPRLLANQSVFRSGLVVGVIWALWHLPLFWIPHSGSGSGWGEFGWFLLQLTGWSVLSAWVYVRTKGNLLLCVLFHAAINTTFSAVLPVAPMYARQDRPILLTDLLIWVVAIVIVLNPFGRKSPSHG